jgi:hypothetical protein
MTSPAPFTCAVLALAALAGDGQGAVLRGRVVTIENRPATDVKLQIAGQSAVLAVRRPSGEFEQPLAGQPSTVQVSVLDGPYQVLYPLDGLVPVPKDESVLVTIVVGKPEKSYIADQLAQRLLRLESILKANGIHYSASADSLSSDLHQVLSELQLRDADLRRDVADRRNQASVTPEILRVTADYVLKVKDLRDALASFPPLAAESRGALEALKGAMAKYNDAFTALNNNRDAFGEQIRSYWPADRTEILQKDLADVYLEAIENIHQGLVLPANPSLIDLQLAYGPHPPGKARLKGASDALTAASQQINARLPALEQRITELRDALERE